MLKALRTAGTPAVSLMAQDQEVEMADVLRRDGKIYTVVIGLVVIVTGLVLFLLRVEKRVKRLGKK